MREFAKLFVAEGIGQILITIAMNDDGDPCLTCRIPDIDDVMVETSIVPNDADPAIAEKIVAAIFAKMTLESAIKMAAPLIKTRDYYMADQVGDDK